MKKTPIYLDTDLEYLLTTYNLLMMPQVMHLKKSGAKGRLAFTIKDDPIFADVLIQVTSQGKLNIYIPEDAPKEEIIQKTLKLLSNANQAPIKVLREKKPILQVHMKKRMESELKKLDKISESNLQNSLRAMLELHSFIMTLPPSLKEKIKQDYAKAEKSFFERKHLSLPIKKDLMFAIRMEEETEIGAPEVDCLIEKISTLLHEQLGSKES